MRDLLEGLLEPIPVLDHGFVRAVDAMPRWADEEETGDHAIAAAARVSYQKGTKASRSDRGLIRYLMRHRHTSPFEMVEIKLHAKMPIFVARQWVRHRTASINEVSARYSVLPEEVYLPEAEHIGEQSTDNKQGRSRERLPEATTDRVRERIATQSRADFVVYGELLGMNIARETSRAVLPLGAYTEWYWKANLLNVLRFLDLRMDDHAQYEIRVYAEAISRIVRAIAPWTWEAFQDYWRGGEQLSRQEWEAVRAVLTEEQRARIVASLSETLSKGEQRELEKRLGPNCAD